MGIAVAAYDEKGFAEVKPVLQEQGKWSDLRDRLRRRKKLPRGITPSDIYDHPIELDPQVAEELIKKAKASAVFEGDNEIIFNTLENMLLSHYPEDYERLIPLGEYLVPAKTFKKAYQAFQELLEREGKDTLADLAYKSLHIVNPAIKKRDVQRVWKQYLKILKIAAKKDLSLATLIYA